MLRVTVKRTGDVVCIELERCTPPPMVLVTEAGRTLSLSSRDSVWWEREKWPADDDRYWVSSLLSTWPKAKTVRACHPKFFRLLTATHALGCIDRLTLSRTTSNRVCPAVTWLWERPRNRKSWPQYTPYQSPSNISKHSSGCRCHRSLAVNDDNPQWTHPVKFPAYSSRKPFSVMVSIPLCILNPLWSTRQVTGWNYYLWKYSFPIPNSWEITPQILMVWIGIKFLNFVSERFISENGGNECLLRTHTILKYRCQVFLFVSSRVWIVSNFPLDRATKYK